MEYWWDEKAIDLQGRTKSYEHELNNDFGESDVGNSIVYIREDVILLVSYLSSANKQLRTISRFCFCILLVLTVIAVNIIK